MPLNFPNSPTVNQVYTVDQKSWIWTGIAWNTVSEELPDNFGIIAVAGQANVVADLTTDTLTLTAGQGIVLTTDSSTDTVTVTSVATTGNVTFVANTVDSADSTAITFTPSVIFDSDVAVYEIVFPDGSRQVSAAGPTPGPQGDPGPPGISGAGTGDVISVGGGYVNNAIVRYDGTSGTLVQNSSGSISDAGLLTAIDFSGGGAALTALNATNLASGTVPIARLGTSGTRDATTFLRGDNTFAVVAGGGGASDSFATIAVAGQSNVVADSATDTLTLIAGTNVTITTNAGTDAITINSTASGTASDSFATIAVAGQSNVVADSATDTLTLIAGTNVTITTNAGTDAITINSTAGGAASDSFATIAVAGQSNVVADSSSDILTLIAGTNVTITTNAGTDAITINSTASGGASAFTGLSDASNLTVDQFYLPAITRLFVIANGSSSYSFDQYSGTNPTIYAISGTTIAFDLSVGQGSHPFLIRFGGVNYSTGLVHVTNTGVVTTGASAQGKTAGTLYWKLPANISGAYQYICGNHGSMAGTITVKDIAGI